MKCRQPWATALAVAAFSALGVQAASAPPADEGFARKAAQAGMDEVDGGRIARERATDESVRRFAERMIEDHAKANEELRRIASSEGRSLPDKLDKSGEQDLDHLTKLHGAAFDRAYMKHNVSGHKKVIKEFEKEARSGHDAGFERFAKETLPVLREHLKLAQAAAAEIGLPKSKKGE